MPCILSTGCPDRRISLSRLIERGGRAMPDSCGTRAPKKRQLLSATELGIVLVVCGIMIWISIPNSVGHPSRIRANEAAAAAALKQYVDAQHAFAANKLAGIQGNAPPGSPEDAYAARHSTLYYGHDAAGNELALINKPFADAGLDAGVSIDDLAPFMGYVFCEDPSPVPSSGRRPQFALMAFPVTPGTTGLRILWIGSEKTIFAFRPEAGAEHHHADHQLAFFRKTPNSTPAVENSVVPWEVADPEWELRERRFMATAVQHLPFVFLVLAIGLFVWDFVKRTPKSNHKPEAEEGSQRSSVIDQTVL